MKISMLGAVALGAILTLSISATAQPARSPYHVTTIDVGKEVIDLDISIDGSRIVTVARNGEAAIWETMSGNRLRTLATGVSGAQFSPVDMRVMTRHEKQAQILDVTTGGFLQALTGTGTKLADATFSPNGLFVATGDIEGNVRVYDAAIGRGVQSLTHAGGPPFVRFSGDGSRLYTGDPTVTGRVWDVTNGSLISTVEKIGGTGRPSGMSRDGKRVVVAVESGLALYDADDGRALDTLNGSEYRSFAFDRAGSRIAATQANGNVDIWDLSSAQLIRTLPASSASGTTLRSSFSHDGSLLLTAGAGNSIDIWSLDDGKLLYSLSGHAASINDAAISLDGGTVVTAGSDGRVKIWLLRGNE